MSLWLLSNQLTILESMETELKAAFEASLDSSECRCVDIVRFARVGEGEGEFHKIIPS